LLDFVQLTLTPLDTSNLENFTGLLKDPLMTVDLCSPTPGSMLAPFSVSTEPPLRSLQNKQLEVRDHSSRQTFYVA